MAELTTAGTMVNGQEVLQRASTYYYELYLAAPVPDAVAPAIANVSPAAGVAITTSTPVEFDVTDDEGIFRRVLVGVTQAGVTEVAHDGDSWLGNYAGGGCSRTPINGGFHFIVLRDGGWLASPTLRVYAIDASGNEAP